MGSVAFALLLLGAGLVVQVSGSMKASFNPSEPGQSQTHHIQRRSARGLLGFATKRPVKTESDLHHPPPPENSFMPVRGRKRAYLMSRPLRWVSWSSALSNTGKPEDVDSDSDSNSKESVRSAGVGYLCNPSRD